MKSANMRISSLISRSGKYFLAIGLIASITAVFFTMRDGLDTTLVALLYLIPLGLITAFWGLGHRHHQCVDYVPHVQLFFYSTLLHADSPSPRGRCHISGFFGRGGGDQSTCWADAKECLVAATAREREATQLYELSTALTGLHDDHAIAQILAKQVQAVSQGEYVKLNITGAEPFAFHLPETTPPTRSPEFTVPIQAARGILGEILLWKAAPAISSSEKRLLQTFASQGALALERARLAQAKSRAKVLEESDHLKSILLSSVSHELRTPLSTIKAAASSLRGHEVSWDSPTRTELIAAIDDEADHLNIWLETCLICRALNPGALKPKREWNILPEIVGSVLARMRYSAEEHKLEIDMPESLPFVPVDYVQMEQVFTNLVSNSLKYAPSNTVIRIRANIEGDTIHVQVSNQGPQIPPEHLERIFDKFYRITAADRVTGTGLGLSICKGIIEAHGGRIWAENVHDGLAFNFTLPLTWEGAAPPQLPMDTETE